MYPALWLAWVQWGWQYMQISKVFGGSYWMGLPENGAPVGAWLLWPLLVLLVYVLPVALLAALPLLARRLHRHFSQKNDGEKPS